MPQPETLQHNEESQEQNDNCSATGGSARSQAADLDERSWRPRPILGGFVRVLAAVGPFIVTYLTIRLAIRVVRRPGEPQRGGASVPEVLTRRLPGAHHDRGLCLEPSGHAEILPSWEHVRTWIVRRFAA